MTQPNNNNNNLSKDYSISKPINFVLYSPNVNRKSNNLNYSPTIHQRVNLKTAPNNNYDKSKNINYQTENNDEFVITLQNQNEFFKKELLTKTNDINLLYSELSSKKEVNALLIENKLMEKYQNENSELLYKVEDLNFKVDELNVS